MKCLSYILGVLILGFALSLIWKVILEFVPFLVAGMIAVTPFYGAFKRKNIIKYFRLPTGLLKNRSMYLKISLLLSCLMIYKEIIIIFFKTLTFSMVLMLFIALLWPFFRFVFKKITNRDILTFREALMFAYQGQ